MFKDELRQLLGRAIDDLNAGHPVLALSAMHDVRNRLEREIAADADGRTELGRVVRENASLRITIHQQAEAIAGQRRVIEDKNEQLCLLRAENEGLDSDLRKCQQEFRDKETECQAAIRIGNEAMAGLKKCQQDNEALRAGNESFRMSLRKKAAEASPSNEALMPTWTPGDEDRWADDRRPGEDRVDQLRRRFDEVAANHARCIEMLDKRLVAIETTGGQPADFVAKDAVHHVNKRVDGLTVTFQSTWTKHEQRFEALEKRLAQLNHL